MISFKTIQQLLYFLEVSDVLIWYLDKIRWKFYKQCVGLLWWVANKQNLQCRKVVAKIESQKFTKNFKCERFEHWRTMCLWICYFAPVISHRYVEYTLVHSLKRLACLFHVRLIDKIRRAHAVLARSKMYQIQNFLKKNFNVSFEKDFIFQFHIYFSASFAFYFLVSNT